MTRGFILTPTYRLIEAHPVVELYARLETGDPALVLDDRLRPYFFVRAAAEDRVRHVAPEARLLAEGLLTFDAAPVLRVELRAPAEVPPLRRRLEAAGVDCFEADVPFAQRYLIDRGLRGAFAVEGPFDHDPGVGRVYRNPRLEPADWKPELRVMAFDLETDPTATHLYGVAAAGVGGERAWIVAPAPVEGAEAVPDERTLVERFLAHVRAADPDVLTGWNVCEFDVAVLLRVCRRLGVRCTLGRTDDEIAVRRDPATGSAPRVACRGRQVVDALALLRQASVKLEDYRLDRAARALLGEGKLFDPGVRGEAIERAYREAPARLAAYNLHDARLTLAIVERLGLVELAVRRSLVTGLPLDRVGAQVAAVESLYLRALRARGRVAPSGRAPDREAEPIGGGLVLEPAPGLYRNIAVYDFKSLYPSLIRTFNIDLMTYVPPEQRGMVPLGTVVETPGGARFRRDEPGILPELVAWLSTERMRAREAGDTRGAQALKILMNSLFGVLGSPASRLYAPAVANAVTAAGQHVLRLAARAAEAEGGRVIYGDTDSLFVDLAQPDTARALARAGRLGDAVGAAVAAELGRECGGPSYLELEFEKLYVRFFLPDTRAGTGGSKKRYAGRRVDGTLEIVGLEAVRRDWSEVARRFQRELLERALSDRPVADFIRAFVADLRAGRYDAALVYRKALGKPLDAYTSTTPPHVQAARTQRGPLGRLVTYIVTRRGPEALGETTAPPDYEHYVTHQLKPLAEPILRVLGEGAFETILGEGEQLSLFRR